MTAQQGYAIGVDLGTSNTVAVLRWPDGRTRPLLFDGVPVMPSAVYLDEAGALHVGRDAQRMAALDPSRLEPNPKRRVDEATVLLGGVEVSTVDLLAALLAAVARTAVEAVGFLPPAAMTYPAGWGPRRREVLAAAATRAGWPPPRFVPEPVAAAGYFADVLRRPVPVGRSLAVFDFGGGTLDIAVVRNAGPAGFEVVGSGGIPDLGGLDVDSALVGHLGGLLQQTQPQAWRPLAAPDGTVQLRQRRLFWDDVRGAKEMLSRTPIAPVAVPGVSDAVHLTREELDRVAGPLLQRAVLETAAVVNRCGLRPDQLAGLFLVGGSSRLPIVARLLHSHLGIAPTVLEQPELPVAEGALAQVVPVSVSAPPTPVSAAPASPAPPLVGPAPAHTQPWYRRRLRWIAAAGLVALVAVVATVVVIVRDPYHEVNFTSSLGEPRVIPMNADSGKSVYYAWTAFYGSRVYLAFAEDDTLIVQGLDTAKSASPWRTTVTAEDSTSTQWHWIWPWDDVTLVDATRSTSDGSVETIYALDGNGKRIWSLDYDAPDDYLFAAGDVLVLRDKTHHQLVSIDRHTGTPKSLANEPADAYGSQGDQVLPVVAAGDLNRPLGFSGFLAGPGSDNRLVQIGADRKARLIDAGTGAVKATASKVGDTDDIYLAYDGRLYAAHNDNGYSVFSYDLDGMHGPTLQYSVDDASRRLESMWPCGARVCLLDTANSRDTTTQLVSLDPKSHTSWKRTVPGAATVTAVGDRVMVGPAPDDSKQFTTVYDANGKVLLGDKGVGQTGARLNDASVLLFSTGPDTDSTTDETVTGYRARSNRSTTLGPPLPDVRPSSCSWTDTLLACARDKDFAIWKLTG